MPVARRPGLLTLLVLGLALVWLARRTRRYVNVPTGRRGADRARDPGRRHGRARWRRQQVDDVRDGVYAATLSTAQARIAGFDAKSNESLTLIARGSGAAFEKAWQASTRPSTRELTELGSNPASSDLSRCRGRPTPRSTSRSAQLDDAGDWDGAVALATGTGPELRQRHVRSVRHELRRPAGQP